MLQCIDLVKDYYAGEEIVHAIKNLSVTFRDNEFVSILGQSGCGKTTLLNIIGGLDNYNSGNLIINGKSTKDYTDKDWDTYRNHRVGFVFQSYNLIMHQSVLQNVELSMTLTGVPKEERRKRAVEALERVGLKDQLNKKPTQMSGGQMQRVAIARALVNDPEILLADEPTGALDSATSVQIMDLLKEIAKDRLVIMVTHNPDLAKEYSTRIIQLKDGEIIADSDPVSSEEIAQDEEKDKMKKPSMKFKTALSLSFDNLLTKKARTFLTAFAGSIGIIGIGLIMSLSNGMQSYIDRVENDTMTSYPITIEDNTMDMSVMLSAMMDMSDSETEHADDKIYSKNFANSILESISNTEANNLTAFKKFLESDEGKEFQETASAIEYNYEMDVIVYNENSESGLVRVSPNGLIDALGMSDMMELRSQFLSSSVNDTSMGNEVWVSLPADQGLRDQEYELVEGSWPQNYNEVVVEVDENNEITDYVLYSLGLMDQQELVDNYNDLRSGKIDEIEPGETVSYTKEELLDTTFKLVLNSDMYEKKNGIWMDMSDDEDYVKKVVADAQTVKVVGIIKPKETSLGSSSTMGGVYYDPSMKEYIIEKSESSKIVQEQMDNPDVNVFTGRKFDDESDVSDLSSLSDEQKMQLASMDQSELMAYMANITENSNATYDSNLAKLGVIDYDTPTSIEIYAATFEDKEKLGDMITEYNNLQEAKGDDANVISYNDLVGVMMSGVSDIINIISYVLMAFVSVSLIVSSIMIGIITYISVLERVKEIGILRAMGASKRDITRVFNAETFIIGLISGLLGVGLTVVLDVPIGMAVKHFTGVAGIAKMPLDGAIFLIVIELILTMIAGLIPARMAAKKDPVEALRSE
jgi:putative ABC transport system permease protein